MTPQEKYGLAGERKITKKYYRFMQIKDCKYAIIFRNEGYIGVNLDLNIDLSDSLNENQRDFVSKFLPIMMENMPGKSRTSAQLTCASLWTIVQGLQIGDIVITPSGEGFYYVGTISSDYYFIPNSDMPHRRKVEWNDKVILHNNMSTMLKLKGRSFGICQDITDYGAEIETLMAD